MERIVLEKGKELIKIDDDFYLKTIQKMEKSKVKALLKKYNNKKERQTLIGEWQ